MYYIYILQSRKDNHFYTGYTSDLRKRIDDHNEGKVTSTKFRRPLQLVYFEGCLSQKDALHREKYLKTAWGKRYINNRIKDYLTGLAETSTTELSKKQKPKTLNKSKTVARQGGSVAGKARKDLEKKLGESVISSLNAKQLQSKKNNKALTSNKKQRNANNK